MTIAQIYEEAKRQLDKNVITIGEFSEIVDREYQEPNILDKIIAEIDDEADYAYADFDKYKEDILHAEADELPDDDFRYGLERAVEIIKKYKRESENKK